MKVKVTLSCLTLCDRMDYYYKWERNLQRLSKLWKWLVKVKVTQSWLTLCDYGILQARILEWVAFLFSSLSLLNLSNPGIEPSLPPCRWILYQLSHKGSPRILEWVPIPSPADLPNPGMEQGSPALQMDS